MDVDVTAYVLNKGNSTCQTSYFMDLKAYEYRGLSKKQQIFELIYSRFLPLCVRIQLQLQKYLTPTRVRFHDICICANFLKYL